MSGLRKIYLALAIAGAVWPMYYIGQWIGQNGMDVAGLIAAWKANAASTGLFADLVISALALSVWVVGETWVRRNWTALWALPATFLIGVSCGLPLYLFLRTRRVG